MKQNRPPIEPDRASGGAARGADGSARSTERGTSSRRTSTSRRAGGTVTFLPVNDTQRSLDARVVAYIRDLIESGQLTAGDRLPPERELAVQLNVSRTVLREALHTLAALGLIELQHGRGIFVTSGSAHATAQRLSASMQADDSAARLRDLFAIRRILEGASAEWAAQRATPEQIAELRAILAEASPLYTATPFDAELAGALDARLHTTIAAASANRTLLLLMVTLVDELGISRGRSLAIPGRAQKSLRQHERLVEAIAAHDPVAARRAMLDHLNDVEQSLLGS